ncbi:pyruvate ferredoxin oxidoreductase [Candidatus Woesearchaeota archaeon]|nr:pyruvate ferredoxin oxidoreductase [Candidatus Woesearchaeota archaeon]
MPNKKTLALTGDEAAAEAMRQIDPDVIPSYPITPQTFIIETFAQFYADGKVSGETVDAESEHSAMSIAVGASAAGARVMTASSSQGIALMFEVLNVASGLRLPIVMNVVNRALSSPLNIHCDHSDSMACRDTGWIQLYSEDAQEVYDHNLIAIKLAESKNVLLPVMVCQDGFITSHCVANVEILDDNIVKKFAGNYEPKYSLLDVDRPITYGAIQLQNYNFETKSQLDDAMQGAKKEFLKIGSEISKITGREYGYFEEYKSKDAKAVIVVLNSTAGIVKDVVDELRSKGKKVGLLKIRLFRPFPYGEVNEALKNAEKIAVLDRAESYGANAPLYSEILNSLFVLDKKPDVSGIVFGLGGREIFKKDIEGIFDTLLANKKQEKYAGLRK